MDSKEIIMNDSARMFDFSGFYDRIANELPNDCKICEVGVADGESALYLARRLYILGKKFKLYMVDNMDYGKYFQIKTIYENIIESGLGKFIEVIPYDSVEASKLFNDNFLHFVFIDASHLYEETKKDILAWYPKVIDEFILSGHDYIGHTEVNKAVNELIPETITRNDIPDREFEPEKFLHTEDTDNGYGLWYCRKDFYKHLTTIKSN